jgi:hypothetical protein
MRNILKFSKKNCKFLLRKSTKRFGVYNKTKNWSRFENTFKIGNKFQNYLKAQILKCVGEGIKELNK